MPQLVPVTLNGVSPATVTFNPANIDTNQVGTLVYRPSGVVANQHRISLQGRPLQGAQDGQRAIARLQVPIIRTSSGVETSVGDMLLEVNFRYSNRSTTAERMQALTILKSLLSSTEYEKLFLDAEAVY